MQQDTLQVTVNAQYIGPSSNVQSPAFGLIDGNGRKFEGLSAALLSPPNMPSAPTADHPQLKEWGEILTWASPNNADYGKKPRPLKGGEKFLFVLSFPDPKDYASLKLSFADVPPIALKGPRGK